jgi:aminoglycoside phosphotransferase (APT) family kinase protein
MLLEHVRGEHGDHGAAMRSIAAIHRAWSGRVEEALALGAHDRRGASLLPHTLVHGDFHAGNVLGSTILDWSDAAVANPLFDVNHYLLHREPELRSELLDAYSATYGEDVAAAADACEAETYEYVAESYAGITAALADDDRWWFADEEPRWLGFAKDVREGRRPRLDP